MSNNVQQELRTTAFGELKTESMTPVTQVSAEYGLLNQVLTVSDAAASGSNTVVDNKFTCQTGTASDGLATILTLGQLKYRPGQGALGRLTAIFSPGAVDSQQAAGLLTASDIFAFGFFDTIFGIIYGHDGENESQELTITTSAGGAENATITIGGDAFVVPLTAGTVQHNAFEIAESLSAQVPNYLFTSNDDQVVAQSVLSGPVGSFAFSSATAVAAWVQMTAGVTITFDFIPQTSWNIDTRISADIAENLDPLKGNVYQVQFQYLGFGAIKFFVEDNETGDLMLVHIIKFANTSTLPSVTNPSFRIGWLTANLGNTTNLTVSGASASAFIEGDIIRSGRTRSDNNDQLSIGTTSTNIITFRNRITISGKVNRAEIIPLLSSFSTQANKVAFFEIVVNATFGGDLIFEYADKETSIMEIAKDNVSVSGGLSVAAITVTSGSSQVLTFNERDNQSFAILPGQTISIVARIPTGAAADCQATGTWQEDL